MVCFCFCRCLSLFGDHSMILREFDTERTFGTSNSNFSELYKTKITITYCLLYYLDFVTEVRKPLFDQYVS